MIVFNKHNCHLQIMKKRKDSPVTSKNTLHPNFKVCLALEGEAIWEIGEHQYQILPGDIVFLHMGQKRCFTAFGKNGFKLCAFVFTRDAFLNPYHYFYFCRSLRQQNNVLRSSNLADLLREAYELWIAGNPFQYEFASAKLTELFIKAETASGEIPKPVSQKDLEMLRIMDYIDDNIPDRISLNRAAKMAGLSESAFSRRFSQWNGVSFKQYVIEKKIQQAVRLLQSTDMKMIDIAMECGFSSVSGFYDAFQKKTGTTPGKFSGEDI